MKKPFKPFRPFITEMLIFIFVVAIVLIGLLSSKLIEISIHVHLITIALFAILILVLLYHLNRVIRVGIRGLIDYLSNNIIMDEYTFISQEPFHASVFSEKIGKNGLRSLGVYYLVHVKRNDQLYTFISSNYLDLEVGKTYRICCGKTSSIITDYLEAS